MTREERLAAGWVRWFIVKLQQLGRIEDMVSYGSSEADRTGPGARDEYVSRAKATRRAMYYSEGCDARVVTLWRRKKPKAPAPLKVGDKVTVRGTVAKLEHGARLPVQVLSATGYLNWFTPQDVERDGKAGA